MGIIKKLIIPVIVIVLLFIGYTMFLKEEGGLGLVTSTLSSDKNVEDILGAEITKSLNQISSINLDGAVIFDNPIYKSLVDRTQDLPKEDVGRNNPFAPLP